MDLLFVSNLFPDSLQAYRGLDNATLLHQLADTHNVSVVSPRPFLLKSPRLHARAGDERLNPDFVGSRYVPKIGSCFNHRLMAAALRPELARRKFDLVLSSWIYPDSCAVSILAKEMKFPFVSIAQGSDVHQYLKIPARRRIIVSALKSCAGIITRSAELARLLGEASVERSRIHPVYNGVDLNTFQPADKLVMRRKLNLPPLARIILFVGNFVAIKNPLLLLRAHEQLDPDSLLVMIGTGPMESQLRGERVMQVGRKQPAEVAAYMQAADLLALPSFNEGVPNVILEAFACGLPVVASRVGGIPEVHNQPFLGTLFESDNLQQLTQALRGTLSGPAASDAIRSYALRFSWSNAAAAYEKILMEALQ